MNKLSLILVFALSACGGGSGGGSGSGIGSGAGGDTAATATPPATPPSMADAFITAVLALVGKDDDNAEPASIDAVAVTTPEAIEPMPVR